jgi:phosphotriesterase-related protein
MLGCGWYVHDAHPAYVSDESEEELASRLVRELECGIDGSEVRATVIGEIGTSSTITERELRCLRAAGTAAVVTGAAIIVHLDPQAQNALKVVETLTDRGVEVERIVLGHMDLQDDLGYLRQAADSGANLSFDTFGTECRWNGLWQLRDPTDEERMERLAYLIEAGFEERLVLSHDVFLKTLLRRYGGLGYAHLLQRIVPHLQDRHGVSQRTAKKLLCDNPQRLLVRRRNAHDA